MVILGVDPGFARTGYGIIESRGSNLKLIDYGIIETDSKIDFSIRLKKISGELEKIIQEYSPTIISVEKIFFCKNTKTAINVSHARGVIILTASKNNLKVLEFTPPEVKRAVTGYGKAEKKQMQKMVQILLNLKEIPEPDDSADALALAICAANNFNIPN
jgi:crossover junction endodeoxyribonuclease RuvC